MTEHDRLFEEAKYAARRRYCDMNREQLLHEQERARAFYRSKGATHEATAACVVIAKLLGEIE
jgi:hypothetical protein